MRELFWWFIGVGLAVLSGLLVFLYIDYRAHKKRNSGDAGRTEM